MNSPLVVGYKGEIGSFILNGLLREMPKASNIWCFDINDSAREIKTRIKKSDVIFLCVPLQHTNDWIKMYGKHLKRKTIIEQGSLKSMLYDDKEIIKLKKTFNLLSMHILFRPSITPNKSDRKVAYIRSPWWGGLQNKIEEITESESVWFSTIEQHDRSMAIQQALNHRILLVLSSVIRSGDQQTYIGRKVLELANRIKGGDPSLYELIQRNKYLPDIIKEFDLKLEDFNILTELMVKR